MTLTRAWAALTGARTSRLAAEGQGDAGDRWTRRGTGRITPHPTGPSLLEWEESGSWQAGDERPTSFRNRLRWTWDVPRDTILLHHLRRGADRPVHLVDLVAEGPDRLTSTVPHLCVADRYQAELILGADSFELRWQVSGPAKQYSLSTHYLP